MAQQRDGVFTWIHVDHLSSATRITDAAGLEIRRLAYVSFGEEAENQGSGDDPKYKYTGKEHDATGLYYFGARYYDPALSRFITADTVYDAGPQGLNRYSYALNNPIIYRDPTGQYISGPDDDPNPNHDGCVTGPAYNGVDENDKPVDGMVYHDNAWDPSSAHHHAPHRFRYGGAGAHRIGKITPAGVITWRSSGYRKTEMWADSSSPIPWWLAEKLGNILGTFSRENINPFTGRPVPYSVREQVVVTSSQLAVSGVAKLAGVSVTASGDDIANIVDDLVSKGEMSPLDINFSQRTVSSNVSQYADDMTSGNWDWSKSGPLRIMKRDGHWVSYDNRRLMAAQKAGLESVPVEIVNPEATMPGSNKTWEQLFIRRFNDPRNIKAGGPVPNQGLQTQPKIVYPKRR